MNRSTTLILLSLLALAVFLAGCTQNPQPPGGLACTEEAKICPDGSSVGRTGPNCEFAACPSGDTNATGCSKDLKTCSDGSSVGRTGPNCEFPACPANPDFDKLPALCKQKFTASGACDMVLTGWEFNFSTKTCEKKTGSGCSGGGPFQNLSDCEKTCLASNPSVQHLDDSGATPDAIQQAALGNNQFGFHLYPRIVEANPGKNVFFSPYSISTALGMTLEGAKGTTASEIQNVFGFPPGDTLRRGAMASYYKRFNDPQAPYILRTANALWPQMDFVLLEPFTTAVRNFYGGNAQAVDYNQHTEQARQTINQWIEDQTSQRIMNLIPPGVLDQYTRLVLTNAVYFKGSWLTQFKTENTTTREFHTNDNSTVNVQMMMRDDVNSHFLYADNSDAQLLEMPYKGNQLSMVLILPKDNKMDAVELKLSANQLADWQSTMVEKHVMVYLPKFKFTTPVYSLKNPLIELGMPTAFGIADFTGIATMPPGQFLYISDVLHKAFVEVNEEGTEAAAATAVVMKAGSAMPPSPPAIFRADHPFIFLIKDNPTGAILFMGKINDPTQGGE